MPMIREVHREDIPACVNLIKQSFKTVADALGFTEENTKLRKWYEENGAVHLGTHKFDFFPFTCGYMRKKL